MKKIATILLLTMAAACKGGVGIDVQTTVSANTEYQENVDSEENLSGLNFRELVDRIPITPIPFGIEGLDTILYFFEDYKIWQQKLAAFKILGT